MFLIDIIINFVSAYEDTNYQLIDERKKIARTYVKGWFSIDLISILPLEHIMRIFGGSGSTGNVNNFLRVTRVGKLYKLVKITRLFRLIKIMK